MSNWKIFQILGSVCGISLGQILLKMASSNLQNADVLGFWFAGFRINVYLIFGLFVLGCATLLWVWVLRGVPLSTAYPFMALAFIIVPTLSYFFLGESIGARQIAGSVLIIVGLLIVSS
jgi:drug/metabolite transporter (DMT)-like permease